MCEQNGDFVLHGVVSWANYCASDYPVIYANVFKNMDFVLNSTIGGANVCSTDQWQCNDGIQCIPSEYRCDLLKDCNDLSDEIGCDKFETV